MTDTFTTEVKSQGFLLAICKGLWDSESRLRNLEVTPLPQGGCGLPVLHRNTVLYIVGSVGKASCWGRQATSGGYRHKG